MVIALAILFLAGVLLLPPLTLLVIVAVVLSFALLILVAQRRMARLVRDVENDAYAELRQMIVEGKITINDARAAAGLVSDNPLAATGGYRDPIFWQSRR